jgi:hypothetical protein
VWGVLVYGIVIFYAIFFSPFILAALAFIVALIVVFLP